MNVVEKYVVWWLDQQSPRDLQSWARAGEALAPRIMTEYGSDIAKARRYLGARGQQAAREASAMRILGQLRRQAPAIARVCMEWWDWFSAQIEAARGLFLVAAPAREVV